VGGDSGDEDKGPLAFGTGTYIKVKLNEQIPNFLQNEGKYIEISYQGIKIQC
jgi:hypothetical protein